MSLYTNFSPQTILQKQKQKKTPIPLKIKCQLARGKIGDYNYTVSQDFLRKQ